MTTFAVPTAGAPRNPWPYAIAAYFVVFIAFIAAFITWAVRQKIDLVRPDYYHEEILFQRQIDSVARTRVWVPAVGIDYDAARRAITIRFPKEHAQSSPTGSIHLYRPSDARLDHEIPLVPGSDGLQSLPVPALQPGLWRVQLRWTVRGEDFYFQQPIIISR